jgi:hypothetical protein
VVVVVEVVTDYKLASQSLFKITLLLWVMVALPIQQKVQALAAVMAAVVQD